MESRSVCIDGRVLAQFEELCRSRTGWGSTRSDTVRSRRLWQRLAWSFTQTIIAATDSRQPMRTNSEIFGPRGFPGVVDDMVRITRAIRDKESAKPLVLLGHSMGSFAAQLYILDYADLVDGVALSGSAALDQLGAAAMSGRWRLEDLNLAFEPARTSFDWLSRDQAEVDVYISDPLCGFNVNEQSYGSMFSIAERLANPSELGRIRKELPLFLFVGDRDPVNANLEWFRPLVDRYREAGLRDVSWHVYGGARHEVLNEINRSEVIAVLQAWIGRICASKT
jgi:alpha-beta hydrolase superfamily lysophospholipase